MKELSAVVAVALVTLVPLGGPAYRQEKDPGAGGSVAREGRVLWTHETGG